jgi:hypothetical protein
MKHVSLLLLSLTLATGSAIATPQSHDHAHAAPTGQTPAAADDAAKAFDTLDTNKDGQLSKEELAKSPMGAHAPMVDADKNGKLSREEFAALQKMM